MATSIQTYLNEVWGDGAVHNANAMLPQGGPVGFQSGLPRYSRLADNTTLIPTAGMLATSYNGMLYQRNACNLVFPSHYSAVGFVSGWYPASAQSEFNTSGEVDYGHNGTNHDIWWSGYGAGPVVRINAWYGGGVVDVYGNVISAAYLQYVNVHSLVYGGLVNANPGNSSTNQPILGYWDSKPEIAAGTYKTIDVADGAAAGIYVVFNNRAY